MKSGEAGTQRVWERTSVLRGAYGMRRSLRGFGLRGRRGSRGMVFFCLVLIPVFAVAEDTELLTRVDELIEAERPQEALSLMETVPETHAIYWRRSQALLIKGDQRADAGAPDSEVLGLFEQGEAWADRAIDAAPNEPEGYYWKSANIGRWGQTRGILESLFRASDMRDLLEEAISLDPEHGDSYFVLAQLYAKVPGLISFGDTAYAVSLGRKAVDLMEADVAAGVEDEPIQAYYVELASHLIDRGWNERRRRRSMRGITDNYRSAGTPLERAYYYEGSVDPPVRPDREEAQEILQRVIRTLEAVRDPLPSDRRRLEQARELLEDT